MRIHRQHVRGQAAVEAAVTLPLVLFLILGTVQLFLLLQSRLMAQYAVFQAARVGSVMNARCDSITDAALLSLLPAIDNFLGNPSFSGDEGQRAGQAFAVWKTNQFGPLEGWGADSIVWIARDRPVLALDNAGNRAQRYFDVPVDAPAAPVHLELKMVFWAPLRIPFANWVISEIALAAFGIQPAQGSVDPLMPMHGYDWGTGSAPPSLTAPIQADLASRVNRGHYVFPVVVSSAVRMMSPLSAADFGDQNCPPTPAGT